MFWMLLTLASWATPTDAQLHLDDATRRAYLGSVAHAFVRADFLLPLAEDQDATLVTRQQVAVALVAVPGNPRPWMLAPEHALAQARDVWVTFSDGVRSPVDVVHPTDRLDGPFARLVAREGEVMARRQGLSWAPAESVVPEALAWTVEWATAPSADGSREVPILVRASLGEVVEHPLERFVYARIGGADGRAMLDAAGRILCLVFRGVAARRDLSLCSPGPPAWIYLGVPSLEPRK